MLILTMRSDKPEAEVSLYDDTKQLEHVQWHAHRQLAETLHQQIADLLQRHGKTLQDIQGIACYEGPGSFTGLRIGLTVANALAYALQTPIMAATGDGWIDECIGVLMAGQGQAAVLPEYGADVHITRPS